MSDFVTAVGIVCFTLITLVAITHKKELTGTLTIIDPMEDEDTEAEEEEGESWKPSRN